MFTLSKLTSLALGFLTLGSVGGIVSQTVLGTINPILEKDISKSDVDLSALISSEQAISKTLTDSKNKYTNALNWLNKLKGIKFHKILEAFTKLFKTEENLESQYKAAKQQLEELEKVLKQKGEELRKKLQYEKAQKSLSIAEASLSSLQKGLKEWNDGFKKIICALNGKEEESDCTSTSSSSRTRRSAPGGGADGEMNGEKAKEALKEVQKSLEETSQQIETANTMAEELKKRVTNMKTYQEALSNVSNFVLTGLSAKESSIQQSIKEISSKITQFSNQIKSLTSEIKTIHQEIELLKKNISAVKNYEGKFLNAICSFYTVENQECNLKQNS